MASDALRRAVFLDRDGVLMVDTGYPSRPSEVRLLAGVGPGLRALAARGLRLVIVSNQSGIARGLLDERDLAAVHGRLLELLSLEGVELDGAYYCPHGPDDGCDCRKPQPGLLRRAAAELDLDLTRSYLVGDKASDVSAGAAAGCTTILLTQDAHPAAAADRVCASWDEVAAFVSAEEPPP
jgi:D-glycero-D-manno-heptose 1,7-bisphosphate phosphatase